MIKNYVKIALRTMLRQKAYTFINIFGLGVGMAACILILLFVQDELSYDRYHEKSDRTYRVTREWRNADGETSLHLGHVAPPYGPLLQNDFPGIIEQMVRLQSGYGPLLTYGENSFVENKFFFAEQALFDVFSWELLTGDPETALSEPNSLVLTESTAIKYFGDEDPVGEVMKWNNFGVDLDLKVTGVIENPPLNSHFTFDVIASFATVIPFFGGEEAMMNNYGSNNYSTYVVLPEGYDVKEFEALLPDFMEKHQGPTQSGVPVWERNRLHLWPITDIHLHSNLDSEIEPNGDIAYVYIFTIIALLTLVIACINFMNLATARSTKRAQEVGLRKVMGAIKAALVRQFIVESVIYAIAGLFLAVGIVVLLLSWFNGFVGKELSLNIGENLFVGGLLVGITLFVGFAAGSYPAFFLSAFQPASILKGEHKSTGGKISLRSILVVFQFTISIALIIGVGVVQDQLEYMRSKDLGFEQDNMLVLPSSGQIFNQFESIKQQLENHPDILSVALTSRMPSGRLLDSQGAQAEVDGTMKQITFRIADVHIDHDYLPNLGVELVAGRNFDVKIASDSLEAFILNESAVRDIGWERAEDAIDKQFNYGNRSGRVIGVVKDFHFESLHQPIVPIVFLITTGRQNSVAIRITKGSDEAVLAFLREQWSFLRPGFPFSYFYLDQQFSSQYANEDRLEKIITYFSALSVVIAALGLFGLASFIAEQRIKEIGIRKVMGASVTQILMLLTKGFTSLVIIAFFIASITAWYFMDQWLDNFAYRDAIRPLPFILGGVLAILIAWITIGSQTIKAARSNPVDAIKYE